MAKPLPELEPMLAVAQAAPPPDLGIPVDQLRAQADAGVLAMHVFVRDGGPMASVEDHTVPVAGGTVPVRVYRPAGAIATPPVHLHLHGGGWFMGSIDTADPMARELAGATGFVVVSVGYRLAPEHRWPTAVEDTHAVLAWVRDHAADLAVDGTSISIGGESAGGNIAACVALMARDRGGPALAGQWLDVPAVDLTLPETDSQREFGTGYGLDLTLVRECLDWYAGEDERRDAYASPARASDLAGLAPALITTNELDPLRDQAEAYAARLAGAGVQVTLTRSAGHLHATTWLTGLTASAAAWHAGAVEVLRAMHAGRSALTAR